MPKDTDYQPITGKKMSEITSHLKGADQKEAIRWNRYLMTKDIYVSTDDIAKKVSDRMERLVQ